MWSFQPVYGLVDPLAGIAKVLLIIVVVAQGVTVQRIQADTANSIVYTILNGSLLLLPSYVLVLLAIEQALSHVGDGNVVGDVYAM